MDFLDFTLGIYSKQYEISTPKGKSSTAKKIIELSQLYLMRLKNTTYKVIYLLNSI